MTGADRRRTAWTELPPPVRAAVAALLGSEVVRAESQNGGFSAGSADRVVLEDGRRAFVKTAAQTANVETARLHAQEARIVATLPRGLPIAYTLGAVEIDGWIVAAYEDVDGCHPVTPWDPGELARVLDAFARIAANPVLADTRSRPCATTTARRSRHRAGTPCQPS